MRKFYNSAAPADSMFAIGTPADRVEMANLLVLFEWSLKSMIVEKQNPSQDMLLLLFFGGSCIATFLQFILTKQTRHITHCALAETHRNYVTCHVT